MATGDKLRPKTSTKSLLIRFKTKLVLSQNTSAPYITELVLRNLFNKFTNLVLQ
jgi:hypothetical protein